MLLIIVVLISPLSALCISRLLRRIVCRTIVGFLSWGINLYLTWANPIRSLDGYRSLPTCPYKWPNGQGDIGKFLEGEKNGSQWQNDHGRIYRIWSGFTSEILLTHPHDVQAVFKDSDKHFKAVNGNAGWLMGQLLGSCLGLISGAEWRGVHSVFFAPFTHKGSTSHIPLISKAVERHFAALRERGSLNSGTIHPVGDFRFLPFWIVAEVLYGELSEGQRNDLQALIPLREKVFMRMLQGGSTRFRWSKYLPSSIFRDLQTFQDKWKVFNIAVYRADCTRKEKAPISFFFGAVESGDMSTDQLLQTMDEMLFANLDVTIGGLSWNLFFLAKNQDVQAAIRKEMPSLHDACDGVTSWKEYVIRQSTLLAASVLESARLRPVAPFPVPQSAPTGRAVGGYWIPAGVNFIVDTHSLNVRSTVWGSDSTQFRPSRFHETQRSATRYSYWRFGFGLRQCLGNHIADLIIRITLARLLATHHLSLAEGGGWERNVETWISQPTSEIRCESLTASLR